MDTNELAPRPELEPGTSGLTVRIAEMYFTVSSIAYGVRATLLKQSTAVQHRDMQIDVGTFLDTPGLRIGKGLEVRMPSSPVCSSRLCLTSTFGCSDT